ncbi:hypothetical protein BCR39DRAFT_583294 [Naematelia encephala]|uniref:Uncharacterized protein n=1 Tax=Naematelia encephala TaxID=71784 RepID=A0A1Y2BEH6_9TREE|nr:hypothetical protein BCR39DRAFT_583294 [Naematelia encephala]
MAAPVPVQSRPIAALQALCPQAVRLQGVGSTREIKPDTNDDLTMRGWGTGSTEKPCRVQQEAYQRLEPMSLRVSCGELTGREALKRTFLFSCTVPRPYGLTGASYILARPKRRKILRKQIRIADPLLPLRVSDARVVGDGASKRRRPFSPSWGRLVTPTSAMDDHTGHLSVSQDASSSGQSPRLRFKRVIEDRYTIALLSSEQDRQSFRNEWTQGGREKNFSRKLLKSAGTGSQGETMVVGGSFDDLNTLYTLSQSSTGGYTCRAYSHLKTQSWCCIQTDEVVDEKFDNILGSQLDLSGVQNQNVKEKFRRVHRLFQEMQTFLDQTTSSSPSTVPQVQFATSPGISEYPPFSQPGRRYSNPSTRNRSTSANSNVSDGGGTSFRSNRLPPPPSPLRHEVSKVDLEQ